MSSQIQAEVNRLFQQDIPQLTSAIDQEIKSSGFDPLRHLMSSANTLGSVDLGVCHASANTNYSIVNTSGLSQLRITDFTSGTLHSKNTAQTEFYGTFQVRGEMNNIQSQIVGRFEAGCGLIHPSEGIGGYIRSSAEVIISGAFTVLTSGNNVHITEISVQSFTLDFTGINLNLNSLGIFSALQSPFENYMIGAYRYQGKNTLQNMLSTPIHSGFQKLLS